MSKTTSAQRADTGVKIDRIWREVINKEIATSNEWKKNFAFLESDVSKHNHKEMIAQDRRIRRSALDRGHITLNPRCIIAEPPNRKSSQEQDRYYFRQSPDRPNTHIKLEKYFNEIPPKPQEHNPYDVKPVTGSNPDRLFHKTNKIEDTNEQQQQRRHRHRRSQSTTEEIEGIQSTATGAPSLEENRRQAHSANIVSKNSRVSAPLSGDLLPQPLSDRQRGNEPDRLGLLKRPSTSIPTRSSIVDITRDETNCRRQAPSLSSLMQPTTHDTGGGSSSNNDNQSHNSGSTNMPPATTYKTNPSLPSVADSTKKATINVEGVSSTEHNIYGGAVETKKKRHHHHHHHHHHRHHRRRSGDKTVAAAQPEAAEIIFYRNLQKTPKERYHGTQVLSSHVIGWRPTLEQFGVAHYGIGKRTVGATPTSHL